MMIEFMGAIGIVVAGSIVMAYFWRRRTFLGGKDVETWGTSVDGMPLEPNFTGANDVREAMVDANIMARTLHGGEE